MIWAPSEDDLKAYGEMHIAYEVRTLRGQVAEIRRRNLGGRIQQPGDLALMEAVLVHARLLDDFLGRSPSQDDVCAVHYCPGWEPKPYLDAELRDRINAQVAHLTARRVRPRYALATMGKRCGKALLELEGTLLADAGYAHRARYLAEAFVHARVLAGEVSRDVEVTYSTSS